MATVNKVAFSERQIAIWLFGLLSLVYLLSAKGYVQFVDSAFSLRTAKALVEKHELSIQVEEAEKAFYLEGLQGKTYSKYGVGLPFLWVPFVQAGKIFSSFLNVSENRAVEFAVSFYNVIFGAATCTVLFFIARWFGMSPPRSAVLALLLGLTTISWHYSVWDFSEMAQAFFLLIAIYGVLRKDFMGSWIASFSFGLLILLKVFFVAYLPAFLLYVLLAESGPSKKNLLRLGSLSTLIVVALGFVCFLNYLRFGNLFETGYGQEAQAFHFGQIRSVLPQLLFSPEKGLFIYSPILILALPGWVKLFRRFTREAIFFASIVSVNLMVVAAWHNWGGGWCWGPRLLVPTVPLWLFPIVFLPWSGKFRWVLWFVAFVSLFIQILSFLVNNFEYLTLRNKFMELGGDFREMPPPLVGSAILLKHKLRTHDNKYRLSEFGVNSNDTVDTSSFEGYKGFDIWYFHLARFYRQPLFKLIPFVFLPLLAICGMGLLREMRYASSTAR